MLTTVKKHKILIFYEKLLRISTLKLQKNIMNLSKFCEFPPRFIKLVTQPKFNHTCKNICVSRIWLIWKFIIFSFFQSEQYSLRHTNYKLKLAWAQSRTTMFKLSLPKSVRHTILKKSYTERFTDLSKLKWCLV